MRQVSGKEFAKILERRGWRLARVHGSHHIYVMPESNQIISVPIHGNKPLRPGILKHMLKLSKIPEDEI